MTGELVWDFEKGIGKWEGPETTNLYNLHYFEKYRRYDKTARGKKLCLLRRHFVRNITDNQLLDIGVGGGGFLRVMKGSCWGYDINPFARKMLEDQGTWIDPYSMIDNSIPAMTFWDSLEHILEPEKLLRKCSGFVFVTLPIFKGRIDCLSSKHFRPGEHLWYWTQAGFIEWMMEQGFLPIEHSTFEIQWGREDVETFAFSRFKKPLRLTHFMRGYTKGLFFSNIVKGGNHETEI